MLSSWTIPDDILPIFNCPAAQTFAFDTGTPAEGVADDITDRPERRVGQPSATERRESRSIIGARIARDAFADHADPDGALTPVNAPAVASVPTRPPGTLPPPVLPFDPTGTAPTCPAAVDGADPSLNSSEGPNRTNGD